MGGGERRVELLHLLAGRLQVEVEAGGVEGVDKHQDRLESDRNDYQEEQEVQRLYFEAPDFEGRRQAVPSRSR